VSENVDVRGEVEVNDAAWGRGSRPEVLKRVIASLVNFGWDICFGRVAIRGWSRDLCVSGREG
jgi:hypothetical protein